MYTSIAIVSIQLNDLSYCYLTQMSKVLFDSWSGPYQVLPFWDRVDLRAMTIKGYPTFPKAPRLEPHHQIVLCHNQDTHWGVLPLWRDALSVFYSPSQRGCIPTGVVSQHPNQVLEPVSEGACRNIILPDTHR